MPRKKSRVAVIMGSDSDYPQLEGALRTLEDFGVAHETQVMSAHRSPAVVQDFATQAERRGIAVIIAAAGGAAHLAGVVAAHTILPVIGVPIGGTALSGFDSLLATVQMPAGVPVATVAVGSAGAPNAALLAVQILARADKRLVAKLRSHKKDLARKVARKNQALQKKLAPGE